MSIFKGININNISYYSAEKKHDKKVKEELETLMEERRLDRNENEIFDGLDKEKKGSLEKKMEDSEEKKRSIDDKLKIIKLIMLIGTVLAALYPIVNFCYEKNYQMKSEIFFGIPEKYFSLNINNQLLNFGLIFLLVIIFLYPVIGRIYEKKNNMNSKFSVFYAIFLSIFLGVYLGLINAFCLDEIFKTLYNKYGILKGCCNCINHHPYLMIISIVIFSSLSLCGPILIVEINFLKKNKVLDKLAALFFAISFAIMIGGFALKFTISIEDNKKYELLKYDGNEYVVLSEIDEKYLVVKYTEENGEYSFYTDKYWFIDQYSGEYVYIDMETEPKIEKK